LRAIRIIQHPQNQTAWASMAGTIGDNILVEQYLMAMVSRNTFS
jgi:hypothetical protein